MVAIGAGYCLTRASEAASIGKPCRSGRPCPGRLSQPSGDREEPMPIDIACPQCQKMLRVPDAAAGKKARCPACQTIVDVPIAAVEVVEESPFGTHAADAANPYRPPAAFPPDPGQPKSPGDDAVLRLLVPVGRSLWAIAAGYLGLFSVLFCPAP